MDVKGVLLHFPAAWDLQSLCLLCSTPLYFLWGCVVLEWIITGLALELILKEDTTLFLYDGF